MAASNKNTELGSWLFGVIVALLFVVVIGLLTVWLSVEKTDLAYQIRNLQVQIEEKRNLKAKLEVERESLLSPYQLDKQAEGLGMYSPKPGQIRRMEILEE